jgi:hypothetical protein
VGGSSLCGDANGHDLIKQVVKHVMLTTPSILVVPLLCCLLMLLTNVVSVVMASSDTHTTLVFAREQNVKLAEAINIVYAQEEAYMLEERTSVESVTEELRARLVASAQAVRNDLIRSSLLQNS